VTRLRRLQQAGVSIWLDTLSRDLLRSGAFTRLVDRGVTGATSNPTIFAAAITGSDAYDEQLAELAGHGVTDPRELFFALALDDVSAAAACLRPIHDRTHGRDGFVSFECTPDIADDTTATVEQASDLWSRLGLPNVMIKVPGTPAGIPAIEELTARGINVNVTLLFAVTRYEQVIDAYLSGLERRAERGERIDHIASVASFFVSRIDSAADVALPPDSPLRGTVAVANGRSAYRLHQQRFSSPRWQSLAAKGAQDQRLLWASTGTKNRRYSDVLYVEKLIAPGVVNTMPIATLEAFDDHGDPDSPPIGSQNPAGDVTAAALSAAGLDLDRITRELEREGVEVFSRSYEKLIDSITGRLHGAAPGPAGGRQERHPMSVRQP
jgi:transaldolase